MMKWLLITLVKGYQTFISAPLHALGDPEAAAAIHPPVPSTSSRPSASTAPGAAFFLAHGVF